jgi:hypothetical protein
MKIALSLLSVIVLAAACFSQMCDSTSNLDSNGNPCTNVITLGGSVENGTPISLELKSQDGKADSSGGTDGFFGIGFLNSGQMETFLPQDPLVTLGYNVVDPFHFPPNVLQLAQGNTTFFNEHGTSGGLSQGSTLVIPHLAHQTTTFFYVFSGSPTAVSVTITGCSAGSCTTVLDTYAGTANTNRVLSAIVTAPYDSFLFNVGTLSSTDPAAMPSLTIAAPCGPVFGHKQFALSDLYVFDSGTERIDPPDPNGNNLFDWQGSIAVPLVFHHCISSGGRGSPPAPVYQTLDGTGELSALPSMTAPPTPPWREREDEE